MTTSGWAIKYTYTDVDGTTRTGLLGKHYFVHAMSAPFGGYQTAVFRTRQQARTAARVAGGGYDRATAVRVLVQVTEEMVF